MQFILKDKRGTNGCIEKCIFGKICDNANIVKC